MTKAADKKTSVPTIILIWLTALGVAFILPDAPALQKYLAASVASILALVYLGYSRWKQISKVPKKMIQTVLFVVQTIFFFYVSYLFWSLPLALWQAPPILNGTYVVTWFALLLVAIAFVGLWSFYLGLRSIWTTYAWVRDNQKKKRRPKGQSGL